MSLLFVLTNQAIEDLDQVWHFIAADDPSAADRVEAAIVAAFHLLARHPYTGHTRKDVTALAVRFWTITKFPNYVVVYRPETRPIEIVGVLHGMRDLRRLLQ
jgi:plasmid stabilization system protein ParE